MTWLLVFVIMLLVVFGMSIGVIMGRKPIAGSCGGIANLGIEGMLDLRRRPAEMRGSQPRRICSARKTRLRRDQTLMCDISHRA